MEGVKAVPRNAQAAAKQKADDLVEYVKTIPDIIAAAAKVRFFSIVVVVVVVVICGGGGCGSGSGDGGVVHGDSGVSVVGVVQRAVVLVLFLCSLFACGT